MKVILASALGMEFLFTKSLDHFQKEKLVLISVCLAKAQLEKATIEQAEREVKVEENVDFHDGVHEEEPEDDGDDYDSVHADDTDGDDNNDCDDKGYDGSMM